MRVQSPARLEVFQTRGNLHLMNPDTLRYAGFWSRLGAGILDGLILMLMSPLTMWGENRYRLFDLYYLVPGLLIEFFFFVYLVKRFGGSPGKLMMKIGILKLDGDPVGYREAILRYLPAFIIGFLLSLANLVPYLRMSDAEYSSYSFMARSVHLQSLTPVWAYPVAGLGAIWMLAEVIVLLTNHKRRAIHDFIAGTVVVHVRPRTEAAPVDATAAVK